MCSANLMQYRCLFRIHRLTGIAFMFVSLLVFSMYLLSWVKELQNRLNYFVENNLIYLIQLDLDVF